MQSRQVILLVACLSCVTYPALGTHILAKAAIVKGGALLAKGAIVKGLLAKGAIAKGAALLTVNGTALDHKQPLVVASKPVTFVRPVYAYSVVGTPVPPQFPTIFLDHLHGLWDILKKSLSRKASGVADLISALLKVKTSRPVVYETVSSTQFAVPIVTKVKLPYK